MNIRHTGERQLSKNDRLGFARAQARKEDRRQEQALTRRALAPSNAVAFTNGQFFVPGAVGVVRISK